MVCSVVELIAAASEVVTLEPGDVIATGTPSGEGAARGLYLRGGDVVRVTIDGLGTRENTVIDPTVEPPGSSYRTGCRSTRPASRILRSNTSRPPWYSRAT